MGGRQLSSTGRLLKSPKDLKDSIDSNLQYVLRIRGQSV